MAVAIESNGVADSGASSTATITINGVTTAGTNRNLWHAVLSRAGTQRTLISIVRTGQADTFAQAMTPGEESLSEGIIWNSTNEPATTSANLVYTINSANDFWSASYVSLSGVDQTTRYDGGQTDHAPAGSNTATSVTVSSAVGDLVLTAFCGAGNVGTLTIGGTGHAQLNSGDQGLSVKSRTGYVAGAATVTPTWSWINDLHNVYFGLNIRASSAATVPDAPTITTSPYSPEAIIVGFA